jgi:hypothetical protein
MKVFPDYANVLMLDSGSFILIVRRREIFPKVEGLFQVERALLKVLAASRGLALGTVFLVAIGGALSQLPRELMERVLRLFDIYATRSGGA